MSDACRGPARAARWMPCEGIFLTGACELFAGRLSALIGVSSFWISFGCKMAAFFKGSDTVREACRGSARAARRPRLRSDCGTPPVIN